MNFEEKICFTVPNKTSDTQQRVKAREILVPWICKFSSESSTRRKDRNANESNPPSGESWHREFRVLNEFRTRSRRTLSRISVRLPELPQTVLKFKLFRRVNFSASVSEPNLHITGAAGRPANTRNPFQGNIAMSIYTVAERLSGAEFPAPDHRNITAQSGCKRIHAVPYS